MFKGDGTVQPVHAPVKTEDEINTHLNLLLKFMNDESVSYLIRIAITHYYFEYIHPFYDGNGRTGRYIASSMIYDLDPLISMKLSSVIKNNHKRYLDVFVITKNGYNRGDATLFVIFMLEMILEASQDINEDLSKIDITNAKLDYFIKSKVQGLYNTNTVRAFQIVAQARMTQNTVASEDIAQTLGVSYSTANLSMQQLFKDKLVVLEKVGRGNYTLDDEVYHEILRTEIS